MSEATPQDGSTVKGYRTLSYGEIGKMNQFKELSRQFNEMLNQHGNDLSNDQSLHNSPKGFEAFEWLRQSKKDMQCACMAACRAVARPDNDC